MCVCEQSNHCVNSRVKPGRSVYEQGMHVNSKYSVGEHGKYYVSQYNLIILVTGCLGVRVLYEEGS